MASNTDDAQDTTGVSEQSPGSRSAPWVKIAPSSRNAVGVADPTARPSKDDALTTSPPPAERLLRLVHAASAASRQLRKKLHEAAASCSLTDAELLVIWLCCGEGHVQVELAGALGISPAQMSGLVERLRVRGVLEMQKQAVDRRRQVWRTSPTGEAMLGDVAGRLAEIEAAIGGTVTSEEQQQLAALCDRLAAAAQSVPRAERVEVSGRCAQAGQQRGSSREAA